MQTVLWAGNCALFSFVCAWWTEQSERGRRETTVGVVGELSEPSQVMRADGLLRRATQKSLAGSVFNILSFSPWPTRRKTFSLTVQSHTDV